MTDDDELQRWIHGNAPRAWRAARRSAIDDAAASDAVQEALLRMLRERPSRAAALDADEFIARSVRAARDSRRSAARRRVREQRHAMDAADRRPAPGAAHDPTTAALDEAVEALPADERELVSLRFRDGLSFAAIGTALGLSESSAHRRLDRVLTALRGRLAALGATAALASDDAAFAAGLGAWGRAGAGEAAPPAGLTDTLVAAAQGGASAGAVAQGAAVFTGARALVATAALVTVGLGAAWAVGGPGAAAPVDAGAGRDAGVASVDGGARAAVESDAAHGARTAADLAPQDETPRADAGRAAPFVLSGRVVDAGGHPVPGAQVTADTVERAGKFALWSHSVRADDDGRYALPVPFHGDLAGREEVRLRIDAGHLGYVLRLGETVEAAPGGAGTLDLQLAVPPGERAGDATIDVLVRDAEGEPVAGALVELAHVAPRDRARVGPEVAFRDWATDSVWLRLEEGRARTDANGRVRLDTERLGAKSLWIEPATDHAPVRLVFPVLAEGDHARDVVVPPGRHLSGDLAWADGTAFSAAELAALQMHVVVEQNRWRDVEVGADGRFTAIGLPEGAHVLRAGPAWDWPAGAGPRPSSAHVEVATGGAPIRLRLKRFDDPRDVGDHRAELHGRVVDVETGEALSRSEYDLFAWRIWDLPGGDVEGDLRPNVFSPPPVQRMADNHPLPDGTGFHEVGLEPGTYMIQVTPARRRGAFGYAGPIVLGEDELRSDIEIRMASSAAIEVTVEGPDGRPLEGAYAFVTGVGPYSDRRVAEADAGYHEIDGAGMFHANAGRRARDGGRCELSGLPSDLRVTVAAVHPDYEPGRSGRFELVAGEAVRVTVQLGARRD